MTFAKTAIVVKKLILQKQQTPYKRSVYVGFWYARCGSNARPFASESYGYTQQTLYLSHCLLVSHKLQSNKNRPQTLLQTGFAGGFYVFLK
ncbi:MAG: hypothetical protein RR764_03915 [Oscillospiraceae bacterium]